jgi:hypothetical protein
MHRGRTRDERAIYYHFIRPQRWSNCVSSARVPRDAVTSCGENDNNDNNNKTKRTREERKKKENKTSLCAFPSFCGNRSWLPVGVRVHNDDGGTVFPATARQRLTNPKNVFRARHRDAYRIRSFACSVAAVAQWRI